MHTLKYLPFLSILFLSSSSLVFFSWQDKSYKYDLPQTVIQDTLENFNYSYSNEIELKYEEDSLTVLLNGQHLFEPWPYDLSSYLYNNKRYPNPNLHNGKYVYKSPIVRIFCNANTKMKYVQEVFDACLLGDNPKLELVTGYWDNNYIGITHLLPLFEEVYNFIQQRRIQGVKKFNLSMSYIPRYTFKNYNNNKRSIIYITPKDDLLFNKKKVSPIELANKLKNTKQALLIYSEEASYGQFLKTKALIHKIVLRDNWNDLALERLGQPYQELNKKDKRTIRKESRSNNELDYTYHEVSEVVYKALMETDF
ncbi:MAG: hypothetical protein GY810_12960 [Aureispira sp.]|nr:hypothetical protein [Aureispira sp.]